MDCCNEEARPRRRWLPLRVPVPGLRAAARLARRACRRGDGRAAAAAPGRAGPNRHFAAPAAAARRLRNPPAALATLTAALPPLGARSATATATALAAPVAAAAAVATTRPAAAAAATSKTASKPATRPASDVLAGALARAASQSIIHPLDTLKVRLQAAGRAAAPGAAGAVSKFGRLVPPAGAAGGGLQAAGAGLASLYKGVFGAASGAGIAIGAYFAFYSSSCNLLAAHTPLGPSGVAFFGGAAAAAGSSVVKVPLAVCIRSVQAGVYPNALAAAGEIVRAVGPRGLFTGYWPTLLEDVPDMAFK
jgi:hypothetical protein